MSVRSRDQLRRDQAALLEEYRLAQSAWGSATPTERCETGGAAGRRIGKITSVVTSDETYGPHLVVKPQVFTARPPVASDSTAPNRIAYPTPNLAVGAYQVDEYVVLWIAEGAELAVKL